MPAMEAMLMMTPPSDMRSPPKAVPAMTAVKLMATAWCIMAWPHAKKKKSRAQEPTTNQMSPHATCLVWFTCTAEQKAGVHLVHVLKEDGRNAGVVAQQVHFAKCLLCGIKSICNQYSTAVRPGQHYQEGRLLLGSAVWCQRLPSKTYSPAGFGL